MTDQNQKLREHAIALGDLLVEKQTQYGDSVGSTGEILRLLYPDGIRPDQYDHLQLVVRVLDKLKRIASQGPDGTDRGGESPWRDIGGYGILGLAQTERSPGSGRTAFMEAAYPGMQATANALLQPQCMKCDAPLIEHVAAEGGVMLCPCPLQPFIQATPTQSASPRCGHCDACATERFGCACDGAEDDGCFLCTPSKHARPPCPATCHGCKHVRTIAHDGEASYCMKTNRPTITSRVEPNGPRPTWCPGFEKQAQ